MERRIDTTTSPQKGHGSKVQVNHKNIVNELKKPIKKYEKQISFKPNR